VSQWSIPLDRLAQRAGIRLETVARKATLDVFRNVSLRSPVDTGRFRANWNVSFGAPNYATTESKNANRGKSEEAKALTLPIGGVTYMSNGLPYASRLEYDSYSKQAPAGMVRITAREFSIYVQRALK
jgi:hypothetical protein